MRSVSLLFKTQNFPTHGHLSNDDAAKTAYQLAAAGVKGILLRHLSEKNNFYELAYETVCSFPQQKRCDNRKARGRRDGKARRGYGNLMRT